MVTGRKHADVNLDIRVASPNVEDKQLFGLLNIDPKDWAFLGLVFVSGWHDIVYLVFTKILCNFNPQIWLLHIYHILYKQMAEPPITLPKFNIVPEKFPSQ